MVLYYINTLYQNIVPAVNSNDLEAQYSNGSVDIYIYNR